MSELLHRLWTDPMLAAQVLGALLAAVVAFAGARRRNASIATAALQAVQAAAAWHPRGDEYDAEAHAEEAALKLQRESRMRRPLTERGRRKAIDRAMRQHARSEEERASAVAALVRPSDPPAGAGEDGSAGRW